MKGPVGSSGDPGAKPLKALVFFQPKNDIFNTNLYRHKIANIGLGRFLTLGPQTTASEAGRVSACARRSRGSNARGQRSLA